MLEKISATQRIRNLQNAKFFLKNGEFRTKQEGFLLGTLSFKYLAARLNFREGGGEGENLGRLPNSRTKVHQTPNGKKNYWTQFGKRRCVCRLPLFFSAS